MQNDKRVTTYLLILLSIAVLIFFTKGAYSDLQIQLSEKKVNDEKLEKLESEKDNLSSIQKDMNDSESEIRQKISRYVNDFSEQDLLTYFYSYADASNGKFIIQSLSLNKKDVNDFGFREGTIVIGASAQSQDAVLDFMEEILDENAKYKIFIEKFSMPEKKEGRNLDVSIPLKIFYK